MKLKLRKRAGFAEIWAAIALPVLLVTAIALVMVSGLVMTALIMSEARWSSEIAYETARKLENQELLTFAENCGNLNLEKNQMVAAVYDRQGKLAGESDVSCYEGLRIPKEEYRLTLEKLKEMRFSKQRGIAGFDETDLYGISYLYGREYFNAGGGIYTLRYSVLIAPWKKYGGELTGIGTVIFLGMLILTFFIAEYYHKIYQERLKAEEYYRNTSNALAHDLKTPLAALSGYAEILRENVHTGKKDYYVEGILRNVAVMDRLIENMLELAKLENPRMVLVKERINLYELTEKILEQFQNEIRMKELKIEICGEGEAYADKSLMRRALENLIGNAVKYTSNGNKIRILMRQEQYQIINTGVMLPEDEIAEIWEPFIKGDKARTNVGGTGIGLTIVRTIMDLHSFGYRIGNEKEAVSVVLSFAGKEKGHN